VKIENWKEFLDKLDFVQLTDRWSLLPVHWLDEDLPEELDELSRDLAQGLLEIHSGGGDDEEKMEAYQAVCREYRSRLSARPIHLDARLTPPGSRVTLRYLNPEDLGQGDCLITTGAWDRLGHLVTEKAHPGGEHLEAVGEEPVRQEPGELPFRHLMLFPDKGTPSPRAFRNLCEKTLRQARGLGARHFAITHLHLPQTGLADRFAAAEVVSAVRQMLRESPGTTVTLLVFSHRNHEDYRHWFESLKDLSRSTRSEYDKEAPEPEPEDPEAGPEVGETLRNFARRSTAFATEASASVSRWFRGQQEEDRPKSAWLGLTFQQQQRANLLYLGRVDELEEVTVGEELDPVELYLYYLERAVRAEGSEQSETDLADSIRATSRSLDDRFPLKRYFQLLLWRVRGEDDQAGAEGLLSALRQAAEQWEDLPLRSYLQTIEEDRGVEGTKLRPPVTPAGSLPSFK